jgi:hypothetical protein
MIADKDVSHNVALVQIMILTIIDVFQFANQIINGMDLNVFVWQTVNQFVHLVLIMINI